MSLSANSTSFPQGFQPTALACAASPQFPFLNVLLSLLQASTCPHSWLAAKSVCSYEMKALVLILVRIPEALRERTLPEGMEDVLKVEGGLIKGKVIQSWATHHVKEEFGPDFIKVIWGLTVITARLKVTQNEGEQEQLTYTASLLLSCQEGAGRTARTGYTKVLGGTRRGLCVLQ